MIVRLSKKQIAILLLRKKELFSREKVEVNFDEKITSISTTYICLISSNNICFIKLFLKLFYDICNGIKKSYNKNAKIT